MKLYRRFCEYSGDFSNISAQIKVYQRFSKYIDLPTKTDNANLLPLLYKVKIKLLTNTFLNCYTINRSIN
ncbi:hypothetical protein bcgnr5373_30570 [Bacillus cereus]